MTKKDKKITVFLTINSETLTVQEWAHKINPLNQKVTERAIRNRLFLRSKGRNYSDAEIVYGRSKSVARFDDLQDRVRKAVELQILASVKKALEDPKVISQISQIVSPLLNAYAHSLPAEPSSDAKGLEAIKIWLVTSKIPDRLLPNGTSLSEQMLGFWEDEPLTAEKLMYLHGMAEQSAGWLS